MMAEGGSSSSNPGGIEGFTSYVGSSVGEGVANVISDTVKPVLPYVLIAVVAYAAIKLGPSIIQTAKRRR
jgi:hypothetical protein